MKAAVIRDERFLHFIESERAKPVQRNLFSGEPEGLRIDVSEVFPEDESVLDDGISVVKTDDMAQLIVSGFGLYLGKKSERLVVRKDKNVTNFLFRFVGFRCGVLSPAVTRTESTSSMPNTMISVSISGSNARPSCAI